MSPISGCRLLSSYLLLTSLFVFPLYSADRLQARSEAPPEIAILADELDILESGKSVYKSIAYGSSRKGIAIFRVNADAQTIWSVIKDFESYPRWIEAVTETEIYRREADLVYVRFSANHWLGGDSSWHVVHHFPEDKDWGSWQLDSAKKSDLAVSVGFWRVLPVTDRPGRSDVVYSVDVRLMGLFAGLFEKSLVETSLEAATSWVKTQSQLRSALTR